MKAATLLAAVGSVTAVLASAIPTRAHDAFHKQKRDVAGPITETITTIFYQTVVWVDSNGTPVSTEVNSPPPGAATTSIENTSPKKSSSTATPVDLGTIRRPSWTSRSNTSSSSPVTHSTISSSTSDTPAVVSADEATPSQISQGPQHTPVSENDASSGSVQSGNVAGGMGICYDMIDSQTRCKTSDTINTEFALLKGKGFGIVRIYDIGCPVGDFVAAASKQGLKVMVGINSIGNFDNDLNTLIGMVNGNWAPVDTVYICNECVNNGAASAGEVAGKVTAARVTLQSKGFSGNVVTVDTFNVMMNDATVCSTSDYCATNIHAFFDQNTSADQAGGFVHNMYNKVVQNNAGKRVVVTESGWPWKGSCNGQACPSIDNQVTAMNGIMGQFSSQASNLFLFQGYDAGYKSGGSFGVEQWFGIFDSDHYDGRLG